jgi:aquaporin Z
MATPTIAQKLVAEFLGTFVLLTVGIGAAIFGFASGINAGFIAIAVGVSIMVGIYAWGNISGGHYNPAVTLSFAVSGRMPARDVVLYWIAQLAGALVGMAVIFGIAAGYDVGNTFTGPLGASTKSIATMTAMGSNGYYCGTSSFCDWNGYVFSAASAVLLEIVATFLFTSVILFSTDKDGWASKGLHGVAIGFTLMILVLLGLGVDGLSVNPARSTGSAVWAAVAGVNWPIVQLWAFWVGPFIGAILGGVVWKLLHTSDE